MRLAIAAMLALLVAVPASAQSIDVGVPSQDAGYKTKSIRNIVYKTVDGQSLKLNLFLPEKNGQIRQTTPLLIHIDSGGWYSGDPGDGGKWMELGAVQKGFAVASVPHRSAAKYKFPAPIEDAKAAVRFLRAHAKEYGLDKTRFAAMGFSSGGHIVSMLGIPDRVKTFDVGENLDESSQVQAVFNFFSTASIDFMLKNNECVDPIYNVLGAMAYKGKSADQIPPDIMELAKKCSPLTYAAKDFSPIINFYGVKDPYIPPSQGCLLHEQLLLKGAKSRLIIANEGVHNANTVIPPQELGKMAWEFLGWK
jgi:acetyl esterase/lipase